MKPNNLAYDDELSRSYRGHQDAAGNYSPHVPVFSEMAVRAIIRITELRAVESASLVDDLRARIREPSP